MHKPASILAVTAAIILCSIWTGAVSTQAQTGLTMHVTGPGNGATVSNPVTVSVQSSGIPIKPATDNDPNAAHYHYFIDRNPATVLQQGQPIPTGQPDIIHTDSPNQQLPTLSPGQHTVWVVLAHTDHTPFNPNVQDQVSFTVAAPGQAAPAAGAPSATAPLMPSTGRGGLLPRAEERDGPALGLQRTVTDDPWLPVLASVAMAGLILLAGLYRVRRMRAD